MSQMKRKFEPQEMGRSSSKSHTIVGSEGAGGTKVGLFNLKAICWLRHGIVAQPLTCPPSLCSRRSRRAIQPRSASFTWRNLRPALPTPLCFSNRRLCVSIPEPPSALCLPEKCPLIFTTQRKASPAPWDLPPSLLLQEKRPFVLMKNTSIFLSLFWAVDRLRAAPGALCV